MAKTVAERQKELRARRKDSGPKGLGEREIKVWVSAEAAEILDRLSVAFHQPKRKVIEALLHQEEENVVRELKKKPQELDIYRNSLRRNE